jgi:hypothetical protein
MAAAKTYRSYDINFNSLRRTRGVIDFNAVAECINATDFTKEKISTEKEITHMI